MVPGFSLWVGIDQTGASLGGGVRARPLPVALLSAESGAVRLRVAHGGKPLPLPALSRSSLQELARNVFPEHRDMSTWALLVDCVFGLPLPVWPQGQSSVDALWALMAGTAQGRYGLKSGQAFFAHLCPTSGTLPRRRCEELAEAVSVFQTYPCQKNVQTGTYRIWKDMTGCHDGQWANIWPFVTPASAAPGAPWIFEAFPSLLWRTVLGLKTRDRTKLRGAMRNAVRSLKCTLRVDDWQRLERDADVADAAVLALSGWVLHCQGRLMEPFPAFNQDDKCRAEGWIVGLSEKTGVSHAVHRGALGR